MNRHIRGVLQLVAAVGVGAFIGFGVNDAVAEPQQPQTSLARCSETRDLGYCAREICPPPGGSCVNGFCECLD